MQCPIGAGAPEHSAVRRVKKADGSKVAQQSGRLVLVVGPTIGYCAGDRKVLASKFRAR